jgi:hypothetical protein
MDITVLSLIAVAVLAAWFLSANWGLSETQDHHESRFNSYEDRMKRIWEEYD